VTGSISTEYVYHRSTTVDSANNYTFGQRSCSKVVSEFEGNAKVWWGVGFAIEGPRFPAGVLTR